VDHAELFKGRVYNFSALFDEESCASLNCWLIDQYQARVRELTIVYSTFGGQVCPALSTYDTIKFFSKYIDIRQVALGMCQSAATVVMTAVELDKRYSGRNTRFMMHSVARQLTDGEKHVCVPETPSPEMLREMEAIIGRRSGDLDEPYALQERIIDLVSEGTHLTAEQIRAMYARDSYFSAEKALEYGLIGHILEPTAPAEPIQPKRWWKLGR